MTVTTWSALEREYEQSRRVVALARALVAQRWGDVEIPPAVCSLLGALRDELDGCTAPESPHWSPATESEIESALCTQRVLLEELLVDADTLTRDLVGRYRDKLRRVNDALAEFRAR